MNSGLHPKVTSFDNQVVSMKMLTADNRLIEVIAKVLSTGETTRWVENPQVLQAFPVLNKATGKQEDQIGMMNLHVAGDQTKPIEIERRTIMSTALARKEAAEEYLKITSSLITPPKQGLIT